MIESISDFMSVFVMGVITVFSLYILFVITDKHHDEVLRKREERYYALFESMSDEYDSDSEDEPYYE